MKKKTYNIEVSFETPFSPEHFIQMYNSVNSFSDSFTIQYVGKRQVKNDLVFKMSTDNLNDLYLSGLVGATIEHQYEKAKEIYEENLKKIKF